MDLQKRAEIEQMMRRDVASGNIDKCLHDL